MHAFLCTEDGSPAAETRIEFSKSLWSGFFHFCRYFFTVFKKLKIDFKISWIATGYAPGFESILSVIIHRSFGIEKTIIEIINQSTHIERGVNKM